MEANLSILFGRDIKTIGKHINNVFKESELEKDVVVAKFATTTQHGAMEGKTQTNLVEYYNLDVIISVGYRVKSKEGTQFRIWANRVLKDYLLKGYAINSRINRLEDSLDALKNRVNEIDFQINTQLIPTQGVFLKVKYLMRTRWLPKSFARHSKPSFFLTTILMKTPWFIFRKKMNKLRCYFYQNQSTGGSNWIYAKQTSNMVDLKSSSFQKAMIDF